MAFVLPFKSKGGAKGKGLKQGFLGGWPGKRRELWRRRHSGLPIKRTGIKRDQGNLKNACRPLVFFRRKAVLLHLQMEGLVIRLEDLGGLGLVPAGGTQYVPDGL